MIRRSIDLFYAKINELFVFEVGEDDYGSYT